MRNFAKTSYKKYLLAGATVLAMGAAPMVAHATPYAFASNQITGLSVTQGNGSAYPTADINGTDQISANATYNGTTFSGPTGNTGAVDAGLSFATQPSVVTSGTAPTGYTPSTPGTFTGTRGNASISAGAPANVNNVAEGYGNANGTSSAGDSSSVKLSISGTGQPLKVAFSDAINLIASTAGVNGENANSTVADSLSLFDSTGKLVASFSPFSSNSMGGTSTGTTFATSHVGSQAGAPPSASYSASGAFTFITNFDLATNSTYTVSLNSSSVEYISAGTPVPEPGSLALLGTGLLGLALVSRKRIKKS